MADVKGKEPEVDGGGNCGAVGAVEGGGVLRVLVVDDSSVDRIVVGQLLRKCAVNYEVISVDSGKRALEVLGLTEEKAEASHINDQKIDLILSDYCMPEMTGYDLLNAVKDHSITKSIPVVIMSSENNPERITRCKATGAEEFLLKPLEMQQVEKLRDYVRRPTSSLDPPPPMAKPRDKRNVSIDLTAAIRGPKRHLRRARIAV